METLVLLIFSFVTIATGNLVLTTFQKPLTYAGGFSFVIDNQTFQVEYTKQKLFGYPPPLGSQLVFPGSVSVTSSEIKTKSDSKKLWPRYFNYFLVFAGFQILVQF